MSKGRLEAFSDGVIAVIITIMVLELQAPRGSTLADLKPKLPAFLSYVLSFIYIGIYWNNHHHLLHAVNRVNGRVLWANLHLLFWLSLVPFATDWMGLNQWASVPVAVYGCLLFMAGAAYTILAYELVALEGKESTLARAFGTRLQRQNLNISLRCGRTPRVYRSANFHRNLCTCCVNLVHSRPPHRKSCCGTLNHAAAN